jgi:hypothetical protein
MDFAWLTRLWTDVMPVLAAWITWTPFEMPSSRLEMSDARLFRPEAVKKFVGLSSAELT